MKTVILALNSADVESWQKFEVDDVVSFLMQQFDQLPASCRIYHNEVSLATDITPRAGNIQDIERLQELEGVFYVIVYPEGIETIFMIAVALLAVAAVVLLKPKIPTVTNRNTQDQSPNNELSERSNKPRPNARIPDIFGTVRSTPDLIAATYKTFINHQEVEYCYMCVGRGYYDIADVRDDTTLIRDITGSSVEVYEPFTSPNSGHNPQLRIGTAINTPIVSVFRSNAVNGQVLLAPNARSVVGDNNIRFVSPNRIEGVGKDFTTIFQAGNNVQISNATDIEPMFILDGIYKILSVSTNEIVLDNPEEQNAEWLEIGTTRFISPIIQSVGMSEIGYFLLDQKDCTEIICNFVSTNGMYKDDGQNQRATNVTVTLVVTPVDYDGNPRAASQTFDATVVGSATVRGTRAITQRIRPNLPSPWKVKAYRVTNADTGFKGQVVDEVKWRDLYAIKPISQKHFGNVTTVQSVTYATDGALAVKERKLNMLVTRKIPRRISGSSFTAELYPTNRADEILSAVALDPYIGNRRPDEVDFDNIYDTLSDVCAYFGHDVVGEFSYTFDSNNLSFEETVSEIARAVHSIAYRRGNQIKLSFEKATELSTLLLNHRNKVPGTEIRSVTFGNQRDNDGVEFTYVDPSDDAVVTMYLPEDQSAVNPEKVESIGIRSKLQAHFLANRIWNKIQFQNVAVEVDATQEAELLILGDRILVTDGTRSGVREGEVDSQDGLFLNLSQEHGIPDDAIHQIFLQLPDGTVESIAVRAGLDDYQVILERPPRLALSVDDFAYAKTTYLISDGKESHPSAFLVSERTHKDGMTSTVKCVNYDARYYQNDRDFINGIVSKDGNVL